MKVATQNIHSERGSAGVKFMAVFLFIILLANAGYNYVPVAYDGASFKQEMDTAVVKGLAASGRMVPLEVVTSHIRRAATDYNVPQDAVIDIRPNTGHISAYASFEKNVSILPFGIYKYKYKFEYLATPKGYLLKE